MKKKLSLFLTIIAMAVWVIMFLAGTDVWNDTGKKDIWNLQGPPYGDLRVFLYCFYGLFVLLLTSLALDIMSYLRQSRSRY